MSKCKGKTTAQPNQHTEGETGTAENDAIWTLNDKKIDAHKDIATMVDQIQNVVGCICTNTETLNDP